MSCRPALLLPLVCALGLVGCGSMMMNQSKASATLTPTDAVAPNPTSGKIAFSAVSDGVRMVGMVRGLAPNSEHGFHIHEKGDCSNKADAAGGHFDPTHTSHGEINAPTHHTGDLPSLIADGTGTASVDAVLQDVSLGSGDANDIMGRALILHRDRDDYISQPSGNSGPRIGCGVISKS
ncbi:MAG: superoxide dismutase family protein [Variovorax sp.]